MKNTIILCSWRLGNKLVRKPYSLLLILASSGAVYLMEGLGGAIFILGFMLIWCYAVAFLTLRQIQKLQRLENKEAHTARNN